MSYIRFAEEFLRYVKKTYPEIPRRGLEYYDAIIHFSAIKNQEIFKKIFKNNMSTEKQLSQQDILNQLCDYKYLLKTLEDMDYKVGEFIHGEEEELFEEAFIDETLGNDFCSGGS